MEDATERAIIRTAIHQDRINSTPRDGNGAEQPTTPIMWAERGDILWTARRVRSPMIDDVGMGVYPGDIIVDRSGVRDGRPVGMGWFVIENTLKARSPRNVRKPTDVKPSIPCSPITARRRERRSGLCAISFSFVTLARNAWEQ